MIKRCAFRAAHVDVFDCREQERQDLEDSKELLEQLGTINQWGTFYHNGRILFFAGYHWVSRGVMEVAMIPSIYVPKYPKLVYSTIKQHLDILIAAFKPHRIQTVGIPDSIHARWLCRLGFHCEGLLLGYTSDKQDMHIWGRVFYGVPNSGAS